MSTHWRVKPKQGDAKPLCEASHAELSAIGRIIHRPVLRGTGFPPDDECALCAAIGDRLEIP